MIKKVMILTFLFANFAYADCGGIGEAQVRGTITKLTKTATSCRVFLDGKNLKVQANYNCPLNEDKLQKEGIEVGLQGGHDCGADVGQLINAIAVDNGAMITLEK